MHNLTNTIDDMKMDAYMYVSILPDILDLRLSTLYIQTNNNRCEMCEFLLV